MSNIYVDSNATGGADGTTWADAFTTLAAAAAVDSAGDIIWVAHDHSESTAAAVTLDWAGTEASPTRIICANSSSGEPPSTLATTAVVSTTGASTITISNQASTSIYVRGIIFNSGDSTNSSDINFIGSTTSFGFFENCAFNLLGNNTGSDWFSTGRCRFMECSFSALHSGSNFNMGLFTGFQKCSIGSGTLSATLLVLATNEQIFMEGFDLSNLPSDFNFCSNTGSGTGVIVRNCKLPSSWSGDLNASVVGRDSVESLHNSDGSDTNYRLIAGTPFGKTRSETTLVRTGGASDGTTTISWKMVSNDDAEWNHQTLDSPEIVQWNDTVGSAITATIEILHDSATNLQDDEVWLEVQYLGTSGFPLSLFVDDAASDYVATPADQTTSSATWTTTGMTNPNKQQLAVSFTPQEKGFIHAVVKLAKASYTVYVDPLITVS